MAVYMLDKAPPMWTGMTPGRQLAWVLTAAAPVCVATAVVGFWPMFFTDPPLAVVNCALFIALIAIGLVLLIEPGQVKPGLAMVASGLLLVVSWSNEWSRFWSPSALPFVSNVVGLLWLLAGGWALYRYPDTQLHRADRAVFRMMLFWFVLTPWLSAVVSRPEWHSFPPDSWWLTLWPNHDLYQVVSIVTNAGTLVFAGIYVARWIVRLRGARPAERRLKTPTSAAAIFAGCVASVIPIGGVLQASGVTSNVLYLISAIGCLSVPVAFLVSVLRRHLARTNLAGLLPRLYAESSPAGVQDALRHALEDPALTLAIWSDSDSAYLDVDALSSNFDERLTSEITSAAGAPIAIIRADPALARDPALLNAAVVAVGLALQNTTLLRTVQAQYTDLREASTRVIQSTDAERQRLERLLHDGAQQHFLALGLMIGVAETSTADPKMIDALSQMRDQLEHALGELRQLARGLHPSSLRMGLSAAVREALRRYPTSIHVDLTPDALPSATKITAYYVICEAVANSIKHADPSKIRVEGKVHDDTLRLSITDDGRGGAQFDAGHGLVGIRDRVTALGGTICMVSQPNEGTQLTLSIPCV